MRKDLLLIPERRHTIVPELVRFFTSDDDLFRFLRTFAGVDFTVPGPEFLKELRRDEAIVRRLRANRTPEAQVEILLEHGVSYSHLADLWRVTSGDRNLPPPNVPGGRRGMIDAAAALIVKLPKLTNDLIAMHGLSARERAACMKVVAETKGVPYEVPFELTEAQKAILGALKRAKKALHPAEITRRTRRPVQDRTVDRLKHLNLITELGSGRLKLTTRGGALV